MSCIRFPGFLKENHIERAKTRQYRSFLLLELLIALALIGSCALPLARIPMLALRQEIKSAYRMEMGRLADLAFAEVKTQLYRTSIAWDLVTSPSTEKALVLDDVVSLSLDATSTKKFRRKAFLYSVGKKGKAGEEYRLATCEITLQPYEEKRKNKRERTFTYQVLLKKTSNISVETPPQTNIPPLPTQSKSG